MIARSLSLSLAVLAASSTVAYACKPDAKNRIDIYPTASELPENLLRIYIYYPRPMAATEGQKHVALLDAQGQRVNGAFLATNQDLWSPDRSRLTLLLDPGRVKSGLEAHEALGRALVPGQVYSLVVSGAAKDAQDCPLAQQDATHSFLVTDADVETPDPATWSVKEPRLGSLDPLHVDLGSTHDHLSMAYRLRVVDDEAEIVPGSIGLGSDEKTWLFTPRRPWRDVSYDLVIDQRLEDLAGNRPGVLFDRPISSEPTEWKNRLPFAPTSSAD